MGNHINGGNVAGNHHQSFFTLTERLSYFLDTTAHMFGFAG
jgi:hypothetical protein